MGMVLEQLFVRVSDAPEVSPNSESYVQQVARVCGLSVAARGDDAKLCTLSGFADTKEQLASGATVSVSDSAMGTCCSLVELLNCDKAALETPDHDAVKVLDAAAFAQHVLQQQEEDHKERDTTHDVPSAEERVNTDLILNDVATSAKEATLWKAQFRWWKLFKTTRIN
ncbi:hypothetical protein JG688_00006966 [Phytophthora aleatoria]|uniref:Uncharacterized protein n=1 Tax=Phytophthora aleatoria TaxID=2496075 RepID=A0A8J5MGM3_9STRA|nr:hypothetical protein JG688_00006966 [Phytophthora aleatoria]